MRTYEITCCTVCGAEPFQEIELAPGQAVRQCENCGAVYSGAYADPEDIYVDDYLLGKGEQDSPFGIHFDMMDPGFQSYLHKVAELRMDAIESVVPRRGRVVDVGCGTGEVLAVARDRGWEAHGAEPIPKEAAFARDERGLDVKTAILEESGLPERSYDVVMAFHVLEHMSKPTEFLRSVARWAKPGTGVVAIEVPNFDSRLRKRSQAFGGWKNLRPLEHITHFTPGSLREAFVRAGLEPVQISSPSYVGPPQTIGHGLDDLVRRKWQPALKPLPEQLKWKVLQTLDRYDDRRDSGMVVMGIARVPEAG